MSDVTKYGLISTARDAAPRPVSTSGMPDYRAIVAAEQLRGLTLTSAILVGGSMVAVHVVLFASVDLRSD